MSSKGKIAILSFAAMSADDRMTFAASAVQEMSRLMAEVKGLGKNAKALKAKADANTIAAHATNIATIVAMELIDENYGSEDYRNTTTGPAYRKTLMEAGFSEAKAKMFWEYGQLSLKEPEALVGLVDAADHGPKSVLAFLAKKEVTKESDLKKIVQPETTPIEVMVDKMTKKLSDAEFEVMCEAVRLIRLERLEAEKGAVESNIVAAVQPDMQQAA